MSIFYERLKKANEEIDRLRTRVKELEAEREVRFGPHEQHHDINVLANLVRKDMALDQQQTFNALVDENTGLKARIRELLGVERKVGNTIDRLRAEKAELLEVIEQAIDDMDLCVYHATKKLRGDVLAKFTNDPETKADG